jgi:YD repeat-containing protein
MRNAELLAQRGDILLDLRGRTKEDADPGEGVGACGEAGAGGRRHYNSADLREKPLGRGHTHEYDHTLRAVVDGWLYTSPDGEAVLFPFAPAGEASESGRFVLTPSTRGFTLRAPDGTSLEFDVANDAAIARPCKMSRGEWSLALDHDARGRLVRLGDAAGAYVVTIDYAGDRAQTISLTRHPSRPQGPPLVLMRYQYSEAGDLLVAIDRYGHAQRFMYDAAHRMLTRVDRNGYRFEYAYDGAGRCALSRGYDRNGEVRLQYMPEAQATEVTRADGGAWLYRYDASMSITEIIDPYGGIRRFEYDESGRLTAETDAGGHSRRPVYDAAGEIVGWRTAAGGLRPADSPSGPLPHRVPRTPAELELRADSGVGGGGGAGVAGDRAAVHTRGVDLLPVVPRARAPGVSAPRRVGPAGRGARLRGVPAAMGVHAERLGALVLGPRRGPLRVRVRGRQPAEPRA